jgi:hypothetical protein
MPETTQRLAVGDRDGREDTLSAAPMICTPTPPFGRVGSSSRGRQQPGIGGQGATSFFKLV